MDPQGEVTSGLAPDTNAPPLALVGRAFAQRTFERFHRRALALSRAARPSSAGHEAEHLQPASRPDSGEICCISCQSENRRITHSSSCRSIPRQI